MDSKEKIDILKKSKNFWKEWNEPSIEKNVIGPDLISFAYNIIYCKRLNKNTVNPKQGLLILREFYPFLKQRGFKYSLNACEAAVLRIEKPSTIHVDGSKWIPSVPGRQFIIPIHIETENRDYKWAGTTFFKQHFLHDNVGGLEWELGGNSDIKRFTEIFGKEYSNLPEFYDSQGNPLEKHNKQTCTYKDFGDFDTIKNNNNWLIGLDIEKYYNWYPGDLIGFNTFTIHAGANFLKDDIKVKYALRINTKISF